uniref:Lipoprotein n=1 Tax=Heterorhabditis bacteriophora TaxID=37862 RepID=A0A1I7X779_HETBA
MGDFTKSTLFPLINFLIIFTIVVMCGTKKSASESHLEKAQNSLKLTERSRRVVNERKKHKKSANEKAKQKSELNYLTPMKYIKEKNKCWLNHKCGM